VLYPDALRVVASCLQSLDPSPFFYSDEDLISGGKRSCPYFKPSWDPVLFQDQDYASRLCTFERRLAIELGNDFDPPENASFPRGICRSFVRAGHVPRHIPEVLYSRREGRKEIAFFTRQQNPSTRGLETVWAIRTERIPSVCPAVPVIHVNIDTTGLAESLHDSLQHLSRANYPRMQVHIVGSLTLPARTFIAECRQQGSFLSVEEHPWKGRYSAWLRDFVTGVGKEELITTLRDDHLPCENAWPRDALTLLHSCHDAVGVCGPVYNVSGRLVKAGEVFGFSGLTGSPLADAQNGSQSPACQELVRCRHSVSVLTPAFHVARSGFLAEALNHASPAPSWELLGLWLGAYARRTGGRLIYSPSLAAQCRDDRARPTYRSDDETLTFLRENADLLAGDPYYPEVFSLLPGEGYLLVPSERRRDVLNVTLSRLFGGSQRTVPARQGRVPARVATEAGA
jgi:hypothetical protein